MNIKDKNKTDFWLDYQNKYNENKFSPSTTPYIEGMVSVIVPVYNVEKYVAKCINSILEQTYTNFELILVNDCSTDDSLKVLQDFKDERITIIDLTENAGGAEAKNVGYREAKGEYIHFLDSDDYFAPDLLQKAIDKIKEVNAELLLNFNVFQANENDGNISENYAKKSFNGEGFFKPTDIRYLFPQWRYFCKHSYLDTCIPFFCKEKNKHDDVFFESVVALPLEKIYCFEGGAYYYLVRSTSLSGDSSLSCIHQLKNFVNVYFYYKEHNLLDIFHNVRCLGHICWNLDKDTSDKPSTYNEIRKVFKQKEIYDLVHKNRKLYNGYNINFFKSVCDYTMYDTWKANNDIQKLNKDIQDLKNNVSLINNKKDNSYSKKTIKLFGFIPFLKIKIRDDKMKVYLFNFILLFKIKVRL
ncbi:MAG: hypothetical protein Ta2D_01100 [Rickettsiales bacterium]|nr:MAG: hypothetical protein Ta2D_01100 [Rickettsiales bacterium]